MTDRALQEIILEADDKDWINCTGYRLMSHQMETFVKKLDEIRTESNDGDKEILKKLDDLTTTISNNKEDGNKRALDTGERIASLETSVKSMSDSIKWMIRTVFFGVGIFILQQIGIIEWITNLIKNLF